ncbi:UNVERIFIED_ORG: hypothetical protein J2X79_004252 [Arthrobacter globiformis]|nr:hypothetical protein [Arthrobacter globiformis]
MTRYNSPPNWPPPPAGWRPPPGWKPDPVWGPPPSGWKFWVEEDLHAINGEPRADDGKSNARPSKKLGRSKPGTSFRPLRIMVLLFLCLVLLAVWQGGRITAVKVGGENGVSAEFEAKADAVQQQQPRLEDRLSRIESELRNRTPSAAPAIGVDGNWQANNGFTYIFQQYGDAIAFSEVSEFGVTAAGQGHITGKQVDVTFQAWNQSIGRSELILNSDGTLSGSVTNVTQGVSFPIVMTRQQ